MKPSAAIIALIVAVVLVTACDRENPNTAASSTNVVIFREAAVSVDVGSGWKQVYNGPGLPNCTPTLVSSNGVVGALLLASDTSMQVAVTAEHQMFMNHTNSLKDSWHQIQFTSGSGLTGQHMSYIETTTRGGNKTLRQTHNFVFQRKDGRLLSVIYVGPVGEIADSIQQMIQSSLKWE